MEIIDKKIIWEGNFIRSVVFTYRDSSGNIRKWEGVERVNCSGIVAIVPVTSGGETLLVRQFRPVVNNFVIEFPAGLNDKGESLLEAAKRELIEETGHDAEEFVLLAEGPLSSGMSAEILTVFLAKNIFQAKEQIKERYPSEETESIEIIKTPTSKINETLDNFQKKGDYIDLKIYGLVELAKKYV
ncbi:MAG: NUDIX hydrolase [Thermodesulfovibrionales bacterium]|nr:NUDIX hydrolase [Thermodesulfovibrionales bacterium]